MKSEKVFIEIPDQLEVRREIRVIMDRGLVKIEKSKLKRNVLVITVSFIILLAVLGFAFPSYASQIPFIGGIFERFEPEHRNYSLMQEFANKIDITGEVEGLSITIEETIFDGQTVYFAYRVESDRELGDQFHLSIENLSLWVDGVDMNRGGGWGASPGVLQQVSKGNYIAVGSVFFPNFHQNIEHAEVSFILGGWYVSFFVEKVENEYIQINETVENEGFKATVTQLVFSPVGVLIHFNFQQSIEYGSLDREFFANPSASEVVEANFEIRVEDDLGNEYRWNGFSFTDDTEGEGWLNIHERIHPEATELIIMPFIIIHSYHGDWHHKGDELKYASYEEVMGSNGSLETREVILGEIVVPIP